MNRILLAVLAVLPVLLCFTFSALHAAPQGSCGGAAADVPAAEYITGWTTDFRKARRNARDTKRLVLILFTISDSATGRNPAVVSSFLHSKDFIGAAKERYVLVHADFPKNGRLPWELADQNARLKNRFAVSLFPTVAVVNPSSPWGGLMLKKTGGFSGGRALLDEIGRKLKQKPVPSPKQPPRKAEKL